MHDGAVTEEEVIRFVTDLPAVVAMTADEVDAFLAEQRTCRVATLGPHGPHATPLWYVWRSGALWLTSLSRSHL